jgi:hypothetical protein
MEESPCTMRGHNHVGKLIRWGKLITPCGRVRIEGNFAGQFTNWGWRRAADGRNEL